MQTKTVRYEYNTMDDARNARRDFVWNEGRTVSKIEYDGSRDVFTIDVFMGYQVDA